MPVVRTRRASARGFTLLEILIAIVILVVGISGIVALFPTAIDAGNQTVQDSYAAAITQSVMDALAVGIRESRYRVSDKGSPERIWTYFIFDHDGVYDRMSPSPQNYATDITGTIWGADWCILLPQGPEGNTNAISEPRFVFPTVTSRPVDGINTDGSAAPLPQPYDERPQSKLPGLATTPAIADNGRTKDSYVSGQKDLWVRRTYMLGRYRKDDPTIPPGFPNRAIREEFLGPPEGFTGTGTPPYEYRPRVDPYPQYSFALVFQRARIDNAGQNAGEPPDGLLSEKDSFSSSLYEVRVLVFRNFDGSLETQAGISNGTRVIPRFNIPIREFITLMSL